MRGAEARHDPWDRYDPNAVWHGRTVVQSLFGASMIGDDELTLEEERDEGTFEADLSTQPLLGTAVQHDLVGLDEFQAGVEAGLLLSFQTDSASFISSGGATTVRVRFSMFVTDLFVGAFASTVFLDAVRVYAGAGPMMVLAWLDRDEDSDDSDYDDYDIDTSIGVGLYARAGIEIQILEGQFLGVGVRAIDTELDFDADSDVEVEGLQAMVTYTIGL